jgi:hypothetical protein
MTCPWLHGGVPHGDILTDARRNRAASDPAGTSHHAVLPTGVDRLSFRPQQQDQNGEKH